LSPFSIFYYLLSGLLYVVALPLLVILSFKQKYKESIPARFFLFRNPRFSAQNGVWFHVCSLGEARALKPLLDMLGKKDCKITAITHTGYAEAKKYGVETRYLPYELFLPFWMRKQKFLVVLEAEFWYMMFLTARLRGTKIILLNARISEKSVKKYLQFAWFYKKLFDCVEIIYAQSEADKNRFVAMGAKNIEVIGNIKLAQKIVRTKEYAKPSCEVIVGASTHPLEEEAILKAFAEYKKQQKDAKLILVPRHPERFDAVFGMMLGFASQHAMACTRFSQNASFEADIVLIDAMGELNNIYAISDIAILGGAFRTDVGGHNPLEPARFGCKIITGKHFFHQKELFKYVHHVQYVEADAIHKALLAAKELPPSMVEETIDLQSVVDTILEK
jgi:3-deoxy-D-manno-octulosonic-acid transferase